MEGRNGGKRILVACHEVVISGGLLRFDRVGRVIRQFGHKLAFATFADHPTRHRTTEFEVLPLAEAGRRQWDATFVPGAGFPAKTIELFSELRRENFGVRVQHVLNDQTRRAGFLKVNHAFAPQVVIFNNRHWVPGDYTDFAADAFHHLEGAVDLEAFTPDPGRRRRAHGDPFVIGAQANKNPGPLVEAVRLSSPEVSLRLFGAPGALADSARDFIESGRLELLGPVEEAELPSHYAGFDCVVHTETFAGWANIVAEAMASGVPTICTPHGTLPIAMQEETALVVAEPDARTIAAAIARLKDDAELTARLTRNARRHVASFSWVSYSAELLRLIERPAQSHYTSSPGIGLYGKWTEAQRLHGLEPILARAKAKTICDLGAGDGIVARRLLERGAATLVGFERDPGRVKLADHLCRQFPTARFTTADLSDWNAFERAHASRLQPFYDIVLYLGLHHHLPAATRLDVLRGAAARASSWFVVRTPAALYQADAIEAVLAAEGLTLQAAVTDGAPSTGSLYLFAREGRVG
ncbi:glycosyltransferase [Faunimonas sp. B44]|uniref:glycosyltransferase n=1 Tax=Faunimonas sp. B44 TaxID=3461493 RepID=UPI0040445562